MTSEKPNSAPTLAIAAVAGSLIILAIVAFAAIAMGGMMDGCGGMGCHRRGGSQTPAVFPGDQVTIEVKDFAFSPRDATIDQGATVTWVNRDAAPHDATDNDGGWATEILEDGDSGSVTFETAGVFEYHCTIHPYMKGKLTVRQ